MAIISTRPTAIMPTNLVRLDRSSFLLLLLFSDDALELVTTVSSLVIGAAAAALVGVDALSCSSHAALAGAGGGGGIVFSSTCVCSGASSAASSCNSPPPSSTDASIAGAAMPSSCAKNHPSAPDMDSTTFCKRAPHRSGRRRQSRTRGRTCWYWMATIPPNPLHHELRRARARHGRSSLRRTLLGQYVAYPLGFGGETSEWRKHRRSKMLCC